MKRPYYNKPKT